MPRKKSRPRVPASVKALSALRKGDEGKADCVVAFRLHLNEQGAFEVTGQEWAHWVQGQGAEPPEGLFEAVGKWIRQRSALAWGEDVGMRAVQVAVNKGLDMLLGPRPGSEG